jgi:SAM-dependent methyltransferase
MDVGSGTSTLIAALISRGCLNVAAVDISASALQKARNRLAPDQARRVVWVVDDVLSPKGLDAFEARVKVWHDRALLHFLIHDGDRRCYRKTMRRVLAGDGFVIIAAFSLDGVDRCSGLPVRRYDAAAIGDFLGPEFELQHTFHCVYRTPAGDPRPYVYTLSRRASSETDEPSVPVSAQIDITA